MEGRNTACGSVRMVILEFHWSTILATEYPGEWAIFAGPFHLRLFKASMRLRLTLIRRGIRPTSAIRLMI